MSHLSVFRIFWKFFPRFFPINEVLSGKQEKVSIMSVRVGLKNPSLVITDCHHSASPLMPIGDPRDGFFYPTLTLTMDTYILLSHDIPFRPVSSERYTLVCAHFKDSDHLAHPHSLTRVFDGRSIGRKSSTFLQAES